MALAEFMCVCVDAADPVALGQWWAAALDLEWQAHDGPPAAGEARGAQPGQRLLFLRVDEPATVKRRVHLDIYTESIATLESMGAVVVETNPDWRWTVMADPEGGEFCGFVRDEVPADRLHGLVVDCVDHHGIAEWWGAAYDATIVHHDDGYSTVEQVPGMPILTMDFVPVPEPKTGKNRIHWDVTGDPGALIAAGARLLRAPDDEIDWTVLADPEGNEFCVFSPGL